MPGYCDPWWYVCSPGGWVEVDKIVGEPSATDFGMDFGGGVRFGVFYAELRYNSYLGPEDQGQETVNLQDLPPNSADLLTQQEGTTASWSRRHSVSGF